MNGRVYDYNLGRFMSVDPFIQEPGNSQSINPYSYIMNNPLAGTDPTGYMSQYGCGAMCDEYAGPMGNNTQCMMTCISTNSSSSNGAEKETTSTKKTETSNTSDLLGPSSISKSDTFESPTDEIQHYENKYKADYKGPAYSHASRSPNTI